SCFRAVRDPHSFPTRRSSDLVLQRYDDGRLDILARGTRPFRLIEREHEQPYPAGTVEFLADRQEDPDPEQAGAAREPYAQLVEQDRKSTRLNSSHVAIPYAVF